ncbi:MAG: tetratricopeptide repeat protein [Candidatus Hermodarchaeota archaeon]
MPDFSKYIDLAKEYERKGKIEKAIKNWKKVVQKNPEFQEAWILMGEDYEKIKDKNSALKCYNKALEYGHSYEAREHIQKLESSKDKLDVRNLTDDQKKSMSQVFDKMTGVLPTPIPGMAMQIAFPETKADVNIIREDLYKQGLLELAQENYDKALKCWKEFSLKRPESFEVWSGLGLVYMKMEKYSKSVEAIEKALKINPTNPLDWERLAMITVLNAQEKHGEDYALEHAMPKSIEYFEKALEYSEPRRIDLLHKIGISYASIGKFDKAIEYVEKYLDQRPDDIQALKHLEALKEQAQLFSKCVECEVKNPIGSKVCSNCGTNLLDDVFISRILNTPFHRKDNSDLFDKGMTFIEKRNPPNAIKCFEKILNTEPNHVVTLEKLGLAYTVNRQPQEAINTFEKILSLNPDQMMALDNLSNLYTQTNNSDKLSECIDRIRDAGSKYIEFMHQVGEEFANGGDMHGATQYWAKILAFDPEHKDTINKLDALSKHPDYNYKVPPHVQSTIKQLLSKSFTYILKSYNVDIDEIEAVKKKQKEQYPGSPTGGKIENKKIIDLFNTAGGFKENSQYSQAISVLHQAIKIDPTIPILYEQLGVNYHLNKDTNNSIKYLEKSIELNPYQILAWENLAAIYNNLGDTRKAEEIFKKLNSFGPIYVNYMVDSGKSAFRKNLIQGAAICWTKALMADPNNKEAQAYLAMLKQRFT